MALARINTPLIHQPIKEHMFTSSQSQTKLSITTILILAIVITLGCITYYLLTKNSKLESDNLAIQKISKNKISTLQQEIKTLKTEINTLKQTVLAKDQAYELLNVGSGAKIDAFAKQALACSEIKKQLNIKGE